MAVKLRHSWLRVGGMAFILALTAATPTRADPPAPAPAAKPAALTTVDPNIEIEDLKLLVEPLTKAQLDVEFEAWFALLRNKATQISDAELAVRRKNREIVSLKEVKAAAEKVADASKVEQKADAAPQSDEAKAAAAKLADANAKLAQSVADSKKEDASVSPSAAPTAPAAAAPAKGGKRRPGDFARRQDDHERAVEAAQKTADKTGDHAEVAEKQAAANKEAAAAKDIAALAAPTPAATSQAAPPAAAQASKAELLVAKTDEAAAAKSEVKVELVDYSTKLGAERTEIIDRFKVVLDQLDVEGGDLKAQRAYISAVSGLKVEVSDYVATFARLKAWAMSDEGGLRWVRNLGLFLAYVVGSMVLAENRALDHQALDRPRGGDVETPAQLHRRHVRPRHRVLRRARGAFGAGNQPGSAARGHRRRWFRGRLRLAGHAEQFRQRLAHHGQQALRYWRQGYGGRRHRRPGREREHLHDLGHHRGRHP